MKLNRFILTGCILLMAIFTQAQSPYRILLNSGTIYPEKNISKAFVDSFNHQVKGSSFLIIQFESIPSEESRKLLSASGIELLEYIPEYAYTVSVKGRIELDLLQRTSARSIVSLMPEQKMEARLHGPHPAWSSRTSGTIDVWISFPKTFSIAEVVNKIREKNFQLIASDLGDHRILHLRLAPSKLHELASQPYVEFVQLAPKGDEPLLTNSRAASRANLLNASIADGGRGLNGAGVVVGVGDNADIQNHIDFSRRLIGRAPMSIGSGHGYHVSGIVAGAGNGNQMYTGYAPRATVIGQGFNGIIQNASTYVNDYGMVLTNNSYGDNIECGYFGTYDLYSRMLDEMAFDLPYLQNVFSAGNSGTVTCGNSLPNYHNVLGGYQSAKNVITVGATNDSGLVAGFSSRGPVKDGRTKPELVAMGAFVASTWSNNIYGYNNGTSMSGPAVTGGLALLVQRYRQLNANADPRNGLLKALVINGSSDRGNAGPDYQYGFGWMNLLRSVEMMENNRYLSTTVTQNNNNDHVIAVPANTARLKVLLYWNDPAASPLAAHTLVNDLDLEVIDPSTNTVLPLVTDTTNANLAQVAVQGIDRINNLEQVVIENPASGNYTVRIKGTSITQNPSQEYFLVYDFVPVQLMITSPAGGETWHPSTSSLEMMKIHWEADGFSSGTVTLEFSPDNGSTWSTVATALDIHRRTYTMFVPNVATDVARYRITKDGTGESHTTNPFVILGRPTVTLASVQCEGYISINWNAITGADDYEVMMLKGENMQAVATTTATSYTFSGLNRDSVYWVTVMPRINGQGGRRAPAIQRTPSTGTCAGSISDNDLKIDAIIAPVSGRLYTSSQLSANTVFSVRIKNLDDVAVNSFDLKYSINGGVFITENIAAVVNAGATYTHNFSATADLSAIGEYQLVFVVENTTPDAVTENDTAYVTIKHLDNQPLDLSTDFVDNMESASVAEYTRDIIGLTGLSRYDFSNSTIYGRLRTFVNSGMSYSGSKALTLDANRYHTPGNTNYLTGTFNLVNYNVLANDVRLDFRFNNHGQFDHADNKIWIRGSDSDTWIEVYDLDSLQLDPGTYKLAPSIELGDILSAHAQSFGTSFQVRWGQWGIIAATDRTNANGYSIDDVRIYEVFNDLQMQRMVSPVEASCALGSSETISVDIRNSDNSTISNIPVRYRVNNGSWVSEVIPSIAANTTVQYDFSTTADLSATGTYLIEAIVDFGADSFRDNDTVRATITNSPVINSFPYLEGFESGAAYWYTGGKNSSWELGTPVSNKINKAAHGANAWKTRLAGHYNDYEYSYLYSPCFDISGMSNPALSFSMALDVENCGNDVCDAVWVEYSTDGLTWNKLGANGEGTNWYDHDEDVWAEQDFTRWHVATISLPSGGFTSLRLRFVMYSDPAVNREGVAIDDVHIYDNVNGIYDGVTMGAPVTQVVSGNSWIDFTTGGKLIASIQPNNEVMGATDVQAFINNGAIRHTGFQYYHDRNITIKPVNNMLSDSVTVRFYFLESELDTLIKATGCSGCTKPTSAYDLGVSKYSDPDDMYENGSLGDDNQGTWHFIEPSAIRMVPFDKGYYAEFRVKDFSEFWLNNGWLNGSTPLPVKLLDFTVQRAGNDAVLKWKTSDEQDVSHFEVELARGNDALQQAQFIKIGEVAAHGNTTSISNYQFTDIESQKTGARFYRLKIVDLDGSYFYSPVRSAVFDQIQLWQVYPNPGSGKFNLVYQLNNNEILHARVLDANGRTVKEYQATGNGFQQKLEMDLRHLASGMYMLQVNAGGKSRSFKLYKQ